MTTITLLNWFILCYLVVLSFVYLVLLAASIPDIFRRFNEVKISKFFSLMKSPSLPGVCVIIPTFNEEENVLETVYSVLHNQYSNISIVLVNGGSADATLSKLIGEFKLFKVSPLIQEKISTTSVIKGYYISLEFPNMTIIDTDRADRSDTLNVGVNACQTPLYISLDADTLLEPDAISRIVFYMLSRQHSIAVGGALYILNGCSFKNGVINEANMSLKPIYAFQTCEYLRSFLFNRSGWNFFKGSLCYAGAFTLFKTDEVVKAKGYEIGNLAQDFEIITRLHANRLEINRPYQLGYTPAAAAWTDVPGTLKDYWRQRYNWQYSTLQSLIPYKRMLFNPQYGIIGFLTYPFFLFGEALGALVEFTAYTLLIISLALGILDYYLASLLFIMCLGFSTFLTMATALVSYITFESYPRLNNLLWILFFSIVENFGFRQYNIICRVSAIFMFFFDKLKSWATSRFKPDRRRNSCEEKF